VGADRDNLQQVAPGDHECDNDIHRQSSVNDLTMQLNRKTGITLTAIAIVAALAWGFWPGPVPVEGAAVVRAPLRVTVEEEGRTRVKDRFIISAPVAGYLQRIQLEVGDAVTQGQTLAVMEPLRPEVLDPRSRARAEAQVAAAQAALKSAEEQVISARAEDVYAQAEFRRKQKLLRDALVSQGDLDQAQTHARQAAAAKRSAEFAVEVARFDREAAQTALQYSISGNGKEALETVKLRAPVASRVLAIHHESEGVVVTGEDLLEIGDPAALEVAVDVLSADAVRIRPGGAATSKFPAHSAAMATAPVRGCRASTRKRSRVPTSSLALSTIGIDASSSRRRTSASRRRSTDWTCSASFGGLRSSPRIGRPRNIDTSSRMRSFVA